MNITLGTEFERRIAEKIDSGLYTSASEVIRDGLRLLFEKDQIRERQAAVLREEVSKGFAQLESGNLNSNSVADIFQKALDLNGEHNKK
jgi:antitoxin ParD1/3/4